MNNFRACELEYNATEYIRTSHIFEVPATQLVALFVAAFPKLDSGHFGRFSDKNTYHSLLIIWDILQYCIFENVFNTYYVKFN